MKHFPNFYDHQTCSSFSNPHPAEYILGCGTHPRSSRPGLLLLPHPFSRYLSHSPQTGLWPRLSHAQLHVCTSLPWFGLFPARPVIWQVWPPDSIFLPLSLLSPTPPAARSLLCLWLEAIFLPGWFLSVLLCCASRPCRQCFRGWWGVLKSPPYRGGDNISTDQCDRSSGATVQREVGRGLVRNCPRPAWGSRRGFWEVMLLN